MTGGLIFRDTKGHRRETLKKEPATFKVLCCNVKQSFGRVDFDLTAEDPTVTYTIINIDGEIIHTLEVKLSDLQVE